MAHNTRSASSLKYGIGRRLFFFILLFSLGITIIGASLQLYLEYSREVQGIERGLKRIERTRLKGIVSSLWVTDYELLKIQMEGVLQLPYIQYLEVELPDKNTIIVGTPQSQNVIQHQFPLTYLYKGQEVPLGMLRVVASLAELRKHLLRTFFHVLPAEAVKIFLISSLIFFLFHRMVGRHLKTMADYTSSLDIKRLDIPLRLERASGVHKKQDELDQLVFSVNEMRKNLAHDIAVRKEAEDSLRMYKYIVSATTDLMAFVDRHYVYQAVNDAYLKAHNKTIDEVIGHTVPEVVGQDVFAGMVKGRLARSLDGEQVHYQTPLNFSGIGERYIDVYYHPFFQDEKSVSGVVLSIRDITEQKRVEERLFQSEKMEAIGTLAGGIAHDFNNLLTPIIGYSELAVAAMPGESPERENFLAVLTAAERAKDLVKQILTFSRKSEQKRKPMFLHPVVSEALKLLRATLPSTIEIQENLDTKCGAVLADPVQIQQIIMNLCTNAFHAMLERGGTLVVSLRGTEFPADSMRTDLDLAPGRYLLLQVSDTGQGMAPEVMERMFEPYFTTKSIREGTGMGLAVVHGIVENHGGKIAIDSKPGQGTTFEVYLPAVGSEGIDLTAVSAAELPRGHERILLIDDEEVIVRMAQKILKFLGYEVTPFCSSVEALEAFGKQPEKFDLVITDQTMPYLTGGELAQKLLEIRADIPIVLCTGFSDILNREQARAIGIRAYISKPVTIQVIAGTIREVLGEKNRDGGDSESV